MKLLHFADLHLGVENYGRLDPETGLSTRLMDFLNAFDTVVDHALEEEVDVVLFAGDAYKTHDPSQTYQREFARRVHRLVTGGVPVFLLVGNHDAPSTWGRANTVEIFATLEVDGVHVGKRPGTQRVATPAGPLQVVALPWVTRSMLLSRDEYKNKSLEEVNAVIVEKLESILEIEIEGLDPEVPAVLVAHGSVVGATYGSERSVLLGQEVILPRSLIADSAFAYVALGHIHKHQVVHEDPPVVYSGSIERIDFGEEKEEKGFIVAEIGAGATSYDFVPVDARRFVTVEVEARGDDPTAQILKAIGAQDVTDAVVRVIIHTTAEKDALIREDDVRQALEDAFYVAAIARNVERATRLRLGDRSVEEMTPREVLERFLETKGTAPERAEVLLEHADEIFSQVDD